MKTKVIAVMVVLSSYFCAASFAQSNIGGLKGGSNNNTTPPPPPVNNTVVTPTPAPTATPNLFGNATLNTVYHAVVKSPEYQSVKNKVVTKVNATKVVKKVSSFKRFLQRLGLAKKTVVARKSS